MKCGRHKHRCLECRRSWECQRREESCDSMSQAESICNPCFARYAKA